jgi:myosin heavy subunit
MKAFGQTLLSISLILFAAVFGSGYLLSDNRGLKKNISAQIEQQESLQQIIVEERAGKEEALVDLDQAKDHLVKFQEDLEQKQTALESTLLQNEELKRQLLQANQDLEVVKEVLENEMKKNQELARQLDTVTGNLDQVRLEKDVAVAEAQHIRDELERFQQSTAGRLLTMMDNILKQYAEVLLILLGLVAVSLSVLVLGLFVRRKNAQAIAAWAVKRRISRPKEIRNHEEEVVAEPTHHTYPDGNHCFATIKQGRSKVSQSPTNPNLWKDSQYRMDQLERARNREIESRKKDTFPRIATTRKPGSLSLHQLENLPEAG